MKAGYMHICMHTLPLNFLSMLMITGQHRELSNISEAMAMLEAEAEAIMEMVGRREGVVQDSNADEGDIQEIERGAAGLDSQPEASSEPSTDRQDSAEGTTPSADNSRQASVSERDTPMEVDQPGELSFDACIRFAKNPAYL